MKQLYWWPGIDRDMERVVRDCLKCHRSDKTQSVLHPPLHTIPCANMPWERIAMDIAGPILDKGIQKYIIMVVDYFTKWAEIEIVEKAD